MKIKVTIDHQTYEVEVGDVHERPIIATIESERFEVWPEDAAQSHVPARAASSSTPASKPAMPAATVPAANGDTVKAVRAPIPGVIISVIVQAGDIVQYGQELCVLEAMKMKNVIRASRAGTIGAVYVAEQQHVKHHDVLMEYAD